MGGGSGEGSNSGTSSGWSLGNSQIEIPAALQPLYEQTANNLVGLQNSMPLTGGYESTLNAGAQPYGYTWVPGTAGTPETGGQIDYYVDSNGNQISVGQYNDAGYESSMPGYYSPHYSEKVAGTAGTAGYYDYSQPLYAASDYSYKETSPDFTASHPEQIAGLNALQEWAAANIKSLADTPANELTAQSYGERAAATAGRLASGATLAADPSVLAAQNAFEKLMTPGIENQMGLAGLGKSSSLANALALGESSYLEPVISGALTREQSALDNESNMYATLMGLYSTLGATDTARLASALSGAMEYGTTLRGVEQEGYTAEYNDFLRRQALAEQALFVPFGATSTASIGQHATSESNQESQTGGTQSQSSGLFK